MKLIYVMCLLLGSSMAAFAATPCPAPTPGSPHVCLQWVASTSTGVTGYNAYRSTTAGGENYGTPLNTAPITTLWFYDVNVAIGTTYYYTFTAVGTGGVLSAPSSEVSAQIPVPPSAPTVPKADVN